MKYFLIEITETQDKLGKAIYEYDTEDAAVASFHSKMGGAMKNENYASELLMVINSEGGTYKNEKWTKLKPDPTPEVVNDIDVEEQEQETEEETEVQEEE